MRRARDIAREQERDTLARKAMGKQPVDVGERRATTGGMVVRVVDEVMAGAEAVSMGVVRGVRVSGGAAAGGVEEIGGRLVGIAVGTARGTVGAVAVIGSELGELTRSAVTGGAGTARVIGAEVGTLAVDATEGVLAATDR